MDDMFKYLLNKKPQEDIFIMGTISTLNPLTVKWIPTDNAIAVISMCDLSKAVIGSRVAMIKYRTQYIVIGVLDSGETYSNYFNFLEYLDYCYYFNTRAIDTCQSGWLPDGGYSQNCGADTSFYLIGANSYRSTRNSTSPGWCIIYKNMTAGSLLTGNNNIPFDMDDYLVYSFYVHDASYFDLIQIGFDGDSMDWTYFLPTYVTGWNTGYIKLSSLTPASGSLNLTSVNFMSFRWYAHGNAYGMLASIQYLGICRKDPVLLDRPCVYQLKTTTGWKKIEGMEQGTNQFILNGDTAGTPTQYKPMLICLTKSALVNSIVFSKHWRKFTAKVYTMVKADGQSPGVSWYVDTNNFIQCYIYDDYLKLEIRIAGTTTTYTYADDVAVNDKCVIYLFKQDGTIRVSHGGRIICISDSFPATMYGDICITYPAAKTIGNVINLIVDTKSSMYQEEDYFEV